MLEAVRILATVTKYTDEQLEGIVREFGDDWLMECTIPVGALIHARWEYENLKRPQDAVTSCARVVAAAERLVDYTGSKEDEHFWGAYLALSREVDNLRNRTQSTNKDRVISDCVDILRSSKSRIAATKAGQKPG